MAPGFSTDNIIKMRKSHKIGLLVWGLFFINDTIALNLPFSTNHLANPISTSPTTNLTNLELHIPNTTATTTVGARKCYPSNVHIPRTKRLHCNSAIWQFPQDHTAIEFDPSEFPIRHKYEDCTVTLTLDQEEIGSWYSVDWAATNLWLACQAEYPDTLRGATGVAGFHGRIFVRIWYEKEGDVTDEGLTAREISEGEMKRDDEGEGLSDEG